MSKQNMPSEELVKITMAALEEIKTTDITMIDVKNKTNITDFIMIANGNSNHQVKSLMKNVLEKVKEQDVHPIDNEGLDNGE